jgi:prepilin-type N-terminal cleavage/methylation domain-containing protein
MRYDIPTSKQGFSLIELMVAIGIFMIFVIASTAFIINGFKGSVFGYEQEDAIANARKAAGVMVKELRRAANSAKGNYIFDTVATNTITFYADTDDDGVTEKIRYFADGINLKKGWTKATGTPMDYIAANEKISTFAIYLNNQSMPIFTYFDTNNAQIANPAANKTKIRLVRTTLKINVTPWRAPQDYYYTADIQIRNLKDNL